MAKWENFSAARVARFQCDSGKKQSIYWDGKTPGLGLRVTAAGAKSYIFETRLHGKTLRITIGDTRTWAIGKAQAEATRLKTLTDQGIDPRQLKADLIAASEAKREEARRQDVTVAEAWAVYIEDRRYKGGSKNVNKWGERHLQDHLTLVRGDDIARKRGTGTLKPGPLAVLMPLKLKELDSDRVKEWLADETATRPTKAALAYRLLRAFIRWCDGHKEYKDAVHLEAVSPAIAKDHVPRPQTKVDDCLQREQLAAWFQAVRAIRIPTVSAYLQGLLLTGARREELAGLRWEDVSFQWQSLRIADKVEGSRTIPLTPYLASLLNALPRRNEWVFSSGAQNSKTGRIADVRYPHVTALALAGLPHISLHGLRRSFDTLSEWADVPDGAIAQIMGHKPSATSEKHYKRRPLDMLRMFHVRIEAWFLTEAGIAQPQEDQAALRLVK